jgi:hypothetical protein
VSRLKQTRVFISYARKDAAGLAHRLLQDLSAEGLVVWLDTENIGGGDSWTMAIEEAIDTSDVVLALMTPGAYSSEICRAEQLRSLRKGKCVVPVLAEHGSDVPLHLEARNYRDFTRKETYSQRLRQLLGDIRTRKGVDLPKRYRKTRVTYVTAPPTVPYLVERGEDVRRLRDALFAHGGQRAIALTALEGMGGIGKTVLAKALCDDEVVQQAFPDGIVWITAGREDRHDVSAKLREITKVLGGEVDDLPAETLYRTTIAKKAALVIIDDIWSKAALDPFLAESRRSRFLFTTRDAAIAHHSDAREYKVDLLDDAQSRELLARSAGVAVGDLPAAAADIIQECGELEFREGPRLGIGFEADFKWVLNERWDSDLRPAATKAPERLV